MSQEARVDKLERKAGDDDRDAGLVVVWDDDEAPELKEGDTVVTWEHDDQLTVRKVTRDDD